MAMRPKKELTEAQWKDIVRRAIIDGVTPYALGKEYGVPASTIRSRLKGEKIAPIVPVANQLASAATEMQKMDSFAQALTFSLSHRLCNISNDLAEIGELGTGTGKTLFAIAASQKLKINIDDPMESQEVLQAIGALTELGNKSAIIGREMLNNNKAIMDRMTAGENDKNKLVVIGGLPDNFATINDNDSGVTISQPYSAM